MDDVAIEKLYWQQSEEFRRQFSLIDFFLAVYLLQFSIAALKKVIIAPNGAGADAAF